MFCLRNCQTFAEWLCHFTFPPTMHERYSFSIPSQKRIAKNIPSNEKQRPATKTTLPSKALNQDRKPNKEFPRQKKSKRIHFHQTSSARDAKGTALRKGRKRERERNTGRKKWQ